MPTPHRTTLALVVALLPLALPAHAAGKEVRYKCPMDKPQKLYGFTKNSKTVVDKDETWTPENVYLVFGGLVVKKTLTIQAGTVVCFQYDETRPIGPPPGSLTIDPGATLKINGTADKHVVFTQNLWSTRDDNQQYWAGMYFASGSHTESSTVQYLDVYNAGVAGANGALDTFPDFKQPPLDFQHVSYYSLQRTALKNLTSGFTSKSSLYINNFAPENAKRDTFGGYPVLRVHIYGAKTVTAETITIGPDVPKATRYVQLDHASGMNIEQGVELHKLSGDLAWRNVGDMKMNGNEDDPPFLKIFPGAVIAVSGYINIGNGGGGIAGIEAVGTKEEPITFTSDAFTFGKEGDKGDWPGIEFYPGNYCPTHPSCKSKSRKSKFDHVIFENGGSLGKDTIYNCNDGRSDRGAVILFTISGYGTDYDGPEIKNSIWRDNAGAGVRARCNVGHGGGCLKTNYADPALGNKFEGYDADNDRPATTPLTCPDP